MANDVFIVDSFTKTPYSGNPAAVVFLTANKSDEWMQAVAAEMNLSETAFVDVSGEVGAAKSLRWFTPTAEVALCGHATLAAAHVLGGAQRFSTKSGELVCTPHSDGSIEMDFPGDPTHPADDLADDVRKTFTGLDVVEVAKGKFDLLIQAASIEQIIDLEPDFAVIAELPVRGVIVTAPSNSEGIDFASRFFAPNVGIPEDPVTGSAHCTLAFWWGRLLQKDDLTAEQVSNRGGTVRMKLRGERVALSGHAVTVMAGCLNS